MSDSLQPHGLYDPWNSPGQNTGVGSLSLLQRIPSPGIKPRSPALWADSLPTESQGKSKNNGVGSLAILQGIFPTQELNWGLLHCGRGQWQPIPVFLPRDSLGQRSLVGCCPWGCTESDMTEATQHACMHWRRKWQPTPVFLPRESQGQRNLVGCRLWGRTESDMT